MESDSGRLCYGTIGLAGFPQTYSHLVFIGVAVATCMHMCVHTQMYKHVCACMHAYTHMHTRTALCVAQAVLPV